MYAAVLWEGILAVQDGVERLAKGRFILDMKF
jgi:hypothetical protein